MSGVFQKLPEALDDLIKDVLPQSLVHVLRVRKLDVGQDDLLIEPQQVRSGKQTSAFARTTAANSQVTVPQKTTTEDNSPEVGHAIQTVST